MSDAETRKLEQQAEQGDMSVLGRLKAAWARSASWRECPDCGLRVPEPGWPRHESEHVYAKTVEDFYKPESTTHAPQATGTGFSGLRVMPLPGADFIGGRPRKEALYWRTEVQETDQIVRFFRDPSGAGLRTSSDTNLEGQGGALPVGQHFFMFGLSLVADEGTNESLLCQVYNTSALEFLIGSTRLSESPGRLTLNRQWFADELLGDPDSQESAQERIAGRCPMCLVTISGLPIEIPSLMAFGFDLQIPGGACASGGLMLVLHGIRLRALTG